MANKKLNFLLTAVAIFVASQLFVPAVVTAQETGGTVAEPNQPDQPQTQPDQPDPASQPDQPTQPDLADQTGQPAQPDQTSKYWDDLMHYALIGKWEPALWNAQALIKSNPDPVQLLDLAESTRYADHYRNLTLLQQGTPLQDVAGQIVKLVEKGRFIRRTDPRRIGAEVARLASTDSTTRGRMLAVERLKDSGEWAVPVMIEALRNPDRADEMASIRWALPQLGKDAVNPLVVVLQNCRDLNIGIIVLDVLGKIGYPSALPYIREIIESDQAGPELKAAALKTFSEIERHNKPAGGTAAELFELLAEDYYNHLPSLQVPATQDDANVWFWTDQQGLTSRQVPRGAFDELMAMRSCERAARLDSSQADAIALWLAAFARLEAEGYEQPAYFGENHADASTYALTAGPQYLHRVLARALTDHNRPVALTAIKTLQRNAGQNALLYELKGRRPLIEALSYPDRQVRFSAALAIGAILPQNSFDNQDVVVPILAEALRQKGQKYALVADADSARRNELVAKLTQVKALTGIAGNEFFSVAAKESQKWPSLDLIVLSANIEHPNVAEALKQINMNYRMAFCPTIVLADEKTAPSLQLLQESNPFMTVMSRQSPVEDILAAAQQILQRNHAQPFAAELADTYASQAAEVLRQLALTDNQVLQVKNAEPALVEAIADMRANIQKASVETLARVNSTVAQRAIAALALDGATELATRLMAFRNLAVSAKRFGNLLATEQIDTMYSKIVSALEVDSELRNLAAEAYGSLSLPSDQISQLILDQSK